MRVVFAALGTVAFLLSSARAEEGGSFQRLSTGELAQAGAFLPLTLSSRVGQDHITALGLGGYDSAPGQGSVLSVVVEGALYHRVAVRVGTEQIGGSSRANALAGLRVGLLDQRRHGVDLGIAGQYKNSGFSEVNGELEFLVTAARSWGRLGLFGNVAFGEGVTDSNERDAEARVAILWRMGSQLSVGFDARARFDLGHETAARTMAKLEKEFDLLAGPLITYSMGSTLLIAQLGAHSYFSHEQLRGGLAAIGGLGYSF